MLLCLGVSILLSHTEIDNVNYISSLRPWSPDQEIVWFDVAIDEVLFVDGLYS